jgi:adenine-specific DNA-methyltransferase
VFSTEARYFQPDNARRIDAIRAAIATRWQGSRLEPLLLTSLIEAADRVDSTTGVQMAYVKQWAPRSFQPLELRRPVLIDGSGTAVLGDARDAACSFGPFDLAYLDPPYNQHRYTANYHVWETLIAGDEPQHYGVACKRIDLRDPETASTFNRKREMPAALKACVETVDADVVVVSCSNEGWVGVDELRDWCEPRGHVEVVAFPSRRYVGAQIGVFNPQGERVGETSHVHNLEYLVIAGPKRRARTFHDLARTIAGTCSP